MILKHNFTAYQVQKNLEKLLRNNNYENVIQLDNELRTITICDSMLTKYCKSMKMIVDLLNNI